MLRRKDSTIVYSGIMPKPMATAIGVIHLDDVIDGGRITVYEGGRVDAVETTMLIMGKDRRYSNDVMCRLSEKGRSKVVTLIAFKLPGKGSKGTWTVALEHAVTLIMVLPGKRSKLFRKDFGTVITRFMDGDMNLFEEIKENKKVGRAESFGKLTHTALQQAKRAWEAQSTDLKTNMILATKSDAFPGLIKISQTENIRSRLVAFNTGCAPAPHVVVATAPTLNMARDKRAAHAFFAVHRAEGEFFAISEEEVMDYFENTIAVQYGRDVAGHMLQLKGTSLTDE